MAAKPLLFHDLFAVLQACPKSYLKSMGIVKISSRLLKNAHLRRFSHPSSLRRTRLYASFLGISGALDLDVFEQPVSSDFFN
jgi:hypothetical protein